MIAEFAERVERMVAERDNRQQRMLVLVSKRFSTARSISCRTGWHERSVQRYAIALESQGLITRTRETSLHTLGNMFWRYSLTDDGKRAIAGS